jgi:hypothetical protein
MNRVTKGEGGNGTIYERLRKRSYRRMQRSEALWDEWIELDENDPDEGPAYEECRAANWDIDEHKAYLAGVRDALNANERAWLRVA